MNAGSLRPKNLRLPLAVIASVFVVGCATQPASGPRDFDIEGKWFWSQNPWHGYFVLEKDGDSYSGTLDNIFEGTYEDEISDVNVTDDNIKFTRDGEYGIQYWQGTLKYEDDLLKIVDGRWQKATGSSGTFYAEKRD